MPITESQNRNEVKKIKFHHKVKRFYYKNLFRKIYTVAIIGLIGANIFSMVKYQSFADELATNTLEVSDVSKDIVIQVTATETGKDLTIYKYFANNYTIDRGDNTEITTVSSDTSYTHTYELAGTYNVTLSLQNGYTRWTFYQNSRQCGLVPLNCYKGSNIYLISTVTNVKIISMPSLEWFGNDSSNPGDYFFAYFNYNGALAELPENSFQFSPNLTQVGDNFFYYFNGGGILTELPENSFNTSKITTIGNYFFSFFNNGGKLAELPENSFQFSPNLTQVGDNFFYYFNGGGILTELPENSFDTSKITTVGHNFFGCFNCAGKLTKLPENSFDTSKITTVGHNFFYDFNEAGALTELSENSFQFSPNLTQVGDYFFAYFNYNGALTELPSNSFYTLNIESVGNNFFAYFNYGGKLAELPSNSFQFSPNLTQVGNNFFSHFNASNGPRGNGGFLTYLPNNSFNTSKIKTVGNDFFAYFNYGGNLSRLPEGSFDLSSIESIGSSFFEGFNERGAITYLPDSFKMSSIGKGAQHFYRNAFYSPDFTLNKKVSELVEGIDLPIEKQRTFSDNQLGRCRVHGNRLYSVENACSDADCGAGYHGVNNKCVSNNAGVYYGDGYIEIRNGEKVIYIKDKNQGASRSMDEIIDKIQELEDLQNNMCEIGEMDDGSPCAEDLHVMCGTISVQLCPDEYYEEAGKIIGITNATKDDIDDFISSVYGNYYYRGNNNGASYRELGVNNLGEVNISQEAYNRGFNGGVMGEDEDNGWIEGNIQDNPCNGEGEYLPTYEDWKDAIELWSDINGYDLYTYDHNYDDGGEFYPMYNGNTYDGNYLIKYFFDDVLLPTAGYLQELEVIEIVKSLSYNQDTSKNKLIDALAMLFTNPVYAYDVRGLQMIFNGGMYLHMALDTENNIGEIGDYSLKYNNIYSNEINNTIAAPVRCFLNSDYMLSANEYTVRFETNGGTEIFPRKVKSGKFLKKVETPEKYGYVFEGWYTDSGLTKKFNTETTQITSNMTLYAKWGKGVTHKKGYIKVTNGKDTMFVRDRNVGATVSQGLPEIEKKRMQVYNKQDELCDKYGCYSDNYNRELLSYAENLLGIKFDSVDQMQSYLWRPLNWIVNNQINKLACSQTNECTNEDELSVINSVTNKDFSDINDAWGYIYYNYDPYNLEYGELDVNSFGNYYFRGNNSGVNYNMDEDDDISGFLQGGKIGQEGEGWIEGKDNPCNSEEGEYLPTGEDWKKLIKIWGSLYGDTLNDNSGREMEDKTGDEYWFYNYSFNEGERFQYDLLIPFAGNIYGYMCDEDDEDCEGVDDFEMNQYGLHLWLAQDDNGNVGEFDVYNRYLQYSNNNLLVHNDYDITRYAMPVRCFIKPEAIIDEPDDDEEDEENNTGDTGNTSTDTPTNPGTSTPTSSSSNHSSGNKAERIKDMHNSAEETTQNETNGNEESTTNTSVDSSSQTSQNTQKLDMKQYNSTYTPEQNSAYQFAKTNGITTTSSIKEAKMNTPLTRIEMAKMLSQYAMNVLGQTPDASRGIVKFKDVTNKMNTQYDNGVTLAYQLGIMGINMPNNEFRPNDTVTRAEFATALSRMIYGTEDGTGKSKYYEPHIARLYNEGIITNTNPKMQELRGYVMTMLMRTVK